jgi:predicted phage-related endonuclease
VNRVDTTRLKKERPDLAEKYSAESSYRRFTVSEVK